MGFSKLEVLGLIASFERRLRGAAPMPLVLSYPSRTLLGSGMGAERDKQEVAKMLILRRCSRAVGCILPSAERDNSKIDIFSTR